VSAESRIRLRRRLLLFSAPVAVVLLLAVLKLTSVVIAGRSADSNIAHRDADALRADVSVLNFLNVVEPEKALFASGNLAVLDGHLRDADRWFSAALADTTPSESCPVRSNLEFVRETMGDRAAETFDTATALTWYRNALTVVDQAPAGCFTGSADRDAQRRNLLDGAVARLNGKIDAVLAAPPPPPPPPLGAAPPPAPPPVSASVPPQPDERLRLDPGSGDPFDRLQQILRDAATRSGG
jgi:hypothetical protein